MKAYYTRHDIAQFLDLTVRQVRDNEKNLGLDKARMDVNRRVVRYRVDVVVRVLNLSQHVRTR